MCDTRDIGDKQQIFLRKIVSRTQCTGSFWRPVLFWGKYLIGMKLEFDLPYVRFNDMILC